MTLFIVNPKSGGKRDTEKFTALVKKYFPDAEIALSRRAGHAAELARDAVSKGYTKIIACGGDGTINEIARALKGTQTALGVIPRGSGNGFARTIGMPLNPEQALKKLQKAKTVNCDLGEINGEIFINVAGTGIEADVAHAFDGCGARGQLPYFWLALQTVFTHKPRKIKVRFDGKEIQTAPLTLAFANGRQYGSDFYIAPDASLTDGQFDMVILPQKNFLELLFALPSFFNAGIKAGRPTKVTKVKEAEVILETPSVYHIDGEPKPAAEKLKIKILPAAVKLLV